jgi:hypothetical protein
MTSASAAHGLPAAAAATVDDYLATFAACLPATRRAKTRIVAEISDGLVSTVDSLVAGGSTAADAARAAVTEFGDPRWLAAEFAAQLTPLSAHRTGVALLVTGPAVGLMWASAYGATLGDWTAKINAVLARIALFPLVLAIVIPAAVLAAGGTGVLARRLAIPPGWAGTAAILAGCGCVIADASLVVTTVAAARPGTASGGLLAVAVGVSTIRACLAGLATRRIVRLRAAAP